MKPLRVIVLMCALGAALVTCGDRFEGSPTFSEAGAPGTAGSASGGETGSAGSGGSAGSAGSAGNAGSAGAGNAPGSAGEAGFGGADEGPAPPVAKEGLVLWLRATHGLDHENGIVSGWTDQSGQGNHATQTADNVKPKLDAGGLNGLPALIFDEDDFLRLPAGFSDFSHGLSVFAVAEYDQEACAGLFHLGNGGEVDDIELGRFEGALLYEVAEPWDQSFPLDLGTPLLTTVLHRESQAVEIRVNQMLAAEPSIPLPVVAERLQNFVGRSDYADCGTLQGKLSELLIYARAVSDAELLEIEGYLQRQWTCCE